MRDYDEPPRKCHACGGTGGTWLSVCEHCDGRGTERRLSRMDHRSRETLRAWADIMYQLRDARAIARKYPWSPVEQMWYGAIRQRVVSPVMLP